jgi:hypothetical protein
VRKWLGALAMSIAILGLACDQAPDGKPPTIASLGEGEPAPAFELESPSGRVSLSEYRGRKAVLLYFSMGPG